MQTRTGGEPAGPSRFLLLADLTVARAGNRAACRVRVTRTQDTFEGEATEPDTELGRARAAARATLAASEHAAPPASFGLEGLTIIDLFQRRYVALIVEAASGRRFAHLPALVLLDPARSPEEAAALAALGAIERWITKGGDGTGERPDQRLQP
jgi:hypothetical protein